MCMDKEYGVPKWLVYQDLLELDPQDEWRKLVIEDCEEEDLEEDLDYVLHCCLEEVNRR